MRVKSQVKKSIRRKSVTKAIAAQETASASPWTGEQLQDAIRLKAYELYVQRGFEPGNPQEDWLAAEQIIKGAT